MSTHTLVSERQWLRQALRPFLGQQLTAATALLVSTLLSLVDPLILKWLVDRGLHSARWFPVLMAVGLFALINTCRYSLLLIGGLLSSRTVQHVMLRQRRRLFRKLFALGAHYFNSRSVGDLVHVFEQDIDQAGQVCADFIPSLIRICVGAAATLMIMIVLDWQLTGVVLPFVLLFVLFHSKLSHILVAASDATRQSSGDRAGFTTETIAGIFQILLFANNGRVTSRYSMISTHAARVSLNQRRVELYYGLGTMAALAILSSAILAAGAERVFATRLTVGGYVAFYSYLMRLFDPLAAGVDIYARVKRAGGGIRRIVELESAPICATTRGLSNPPLLSPKLICKNVTFRYDTHRSLLRNINLTLDPGQKIAIVGPSGSGKSTLTKLLVRLYDPGSGVVSLGGFDLKTLSPTAISRAISLLPQRPVLFQGTIRENILLANPQATDSQIQRAGEIACFDSVLRTLPSGLHHVLGPSGAGLSDGEKQRLGLLRAILRDQSVLILDEATSALDPALEKLLLQNLSNNMSDKSILIITHRPSTALWADATLVLQDGELVSNDSGATNLPAEERQLRYRQQLTNSECSGTAGATEYIRRGA